MFLLTEAAQKQIKQQLQEANAPAIEVAVKKSGCSGYMYYLNLCNEVDDRFDILFDQGVKVVALKEHQPFLGHLSLDYVQQGINRTFKFSNPDARSECGCGESFLF